MKTQSFLSKHDISRWLEVLCECACMAGRLGDLVRHAERPQPCSRAQVALPSPNLSRSSSKARTIVAIPDGETFQYSGDIMWCLRCAAKLHSGSCLSLKTSSTVQRGKRSPSLRIWNIGHPVSTGCTTTQPNFRSLGKRPVIANRCRPQRQSDSKTGSAHACRAPNCDHSQCCPETLCVRPRAIGAEIDSGPADRVQLMACPIPTSCPSLLRPPHLLHTGSVFSYMISRIRGHRSSKSYVVHLFGRHDHQHTFEFFFLLLLVRKLR